VPQVVEIDAPGIARALGEDLELVPHRVIPPDAGVDPHAVGIGRPRLADRGVREHAVAAVEPAIGPPDETVQCLVRVLRAPAVEEDAGRGGAHPDTAEPDGDAAGEIQPLDEHLPRIERVVAVGVLEHQDPVTGLRLGQRVRVGVALDHPQPAAVVEAHRDRLADVGLRGQQLDGEARGRDRRP